MLTIEIRFPPKAYSWIIVAPRFTLYHYPHGKPAHSKEAKHHYLWGAYYGATLPADRVPYDLIIKNRESYMSVFDLEY